MNIRARQITFSPRNHELDNNDNFSPDDRFLCYDTRAAAASIGGTLTIEKVEIDTWTETVLYRAPDPVPGQGPGLGAVSYHPTEHRVIFIHGPLTSTGFRYDQAHRFGVSVSGAGDGSPEYVDARDVTSPFTPGALRGGTHRHEFDGTGRWVGFTYNDAVMKARGVDLRTIGVTRLGMPVSVDDGPGNRNGTGFSALVVRVVPEPFPGSDAISRAAGDSWVGTRGYRKFDGSWQLARGFIGTTVDRRGEPLEEVYIVDIPADISRPGLIGPVEGTATTLPAPVEGATQRRLTHTGDRAYPGCEGIVRSSPDGTWLAFTARAVGGDVDGTRQVFLVSPGGGETRQLSRVPGGVEQGARWHPSGRAVIATDTARRIVWLSTTAGESFGALAVLLDDGGTRPNALVVSHDGSMVAFNRQVIDGSGSHSQIFVIPCGAADGGPPTAIRATR